MIPEMLLVSNSAQQLLSLQLFMVTEIVTSVDTSSKTWVVWRRRSKKYVLGIKGEQAQESDKKEALKEKAMLIAFFFHN